MRELRCKKCYKLLAKYDGGVEVKCPICKTLNRITHTLTHSFEQTTE
jgi:LSD1 subclass zinc finger protein